MLVKNTRRNPSTADSLLLLLPQTYHGRRWRISESFLSYTSLFQSLEAITVAIGVADQYLCCILLQLREWATLPPCNTAVLKFGSGPLFFFFLTDLTYPKVSLASHTLRRERKGLVVLQPLSCCHGRNLMWQIRSVLIIHRIRCHRVAIMLQHVQRTSVSYFLLTTIFYNCIPQWQLIGCRMIRPSLPLCEGCGLQDYPKVF